MWTEEVESDGMSVCLQLVSKVIPYLHHLISCFSQAGYGAANKIVFVCGGGGGRTMHLCCESR